MRSFLKLPGKIKIPEKLPVQIILPELLFISMHLINLMTILLLGLSVYTPYGSTVKWEDDWAGSHLVNNIELQAIYIQPLSFL